MNEDRIEGTAKKVVGAVQETVGDVTGDEALQGKGLLNQAGGVVQDSYGKVRDKVKDIIDDAPATAKTALDTSRDYYQRGSAAVTRTMGDNGALALLAAGAAGAALSWLIFGRRGGASKE
ncbi:MAG TPA: CsbD family protein [Sphingomonas sp.]